MIELILFDLGGVLVELTGLPTMLQWTNHKYDVEALWEKWLRSPAVRAFETGRSTADQFAEDIIEEMALPVAKPEFIERFTHWPRGLFPGVPPLLDKLKIDYTLACFSNSNSLHWPILMNEMALETKFSYHFGSHLIGKVKPDKEAFEHVVNHLNCKPGSVIFLDDNIINVESALEMGMRAFRAKGPKEVEVILGELGVYETRIA